MASRIVVFPVMGRRWAFTSVLPNGGNQGQRNSLQPGTMRELMRSLRQSPCMGDKPELLTHFVSEKMHEKFHAWGAAPEGSIRQRLHRIGQRLVSRLGPTETLLKSIPKDAKLLEIVYPNRVNPRLVRRRVRHLAISGEVIHRRYMYGAVAMLPFSAILGLLPLPNVVLAWNLFRAYSHWRALQGSKRLHYLVTDGPSSLSTLQPQKIVHEKDSSTSGVHRLYEEKAEMDQSNHWVFLPSEILGSLLEPANMPGNAISDGTVAEICRKYPLDPIEIMKWRDQRLPIKSFG